MDVDKLEVSNYYFNGAYFHWFNTLCTGQYRTKVTTKSPHHSPTATRTSCGEVWRQWWRSLSGDWWCCTPGRKAAWNHSRNTSSHPAVGQEKVRVTWSEVKDFRGNEKPRRTHRPHRCVQIHIYTDLQVTDNAVGLFSPHPACGRGLQVLLSSNQQVPRCWVTAAMGTAVAEVRLLANGSSQAWGGRQEISYNEQETAVQSAIIRAPIHKLVLAIKLDLKSVDFYLSKRKETKKLLSLRK